MAVTAGMVKELRELTGAGMLDCKKALTESDGNIEKAVELLREKGLAAAQKKAGRIAAEGLVYSYISEDNKIGTLVEVNSETDFVAKNQEFKSFVSQVVKQAAYTNATDIEAFLQDKWEFDNNATIADILTQKISIIGEKLSVRRFTKFVKQESGVLSTYVHGEGKIAVLVELACEKQDPILNEVGKNLSMQISALSPKFTGRDNVSPDFIEKEREVLKQQALNEGKPANIVEKMIDGRLVKSLKEICLLDQEYVKDTEITVNDYVNQAGKEIGAPITITRFERYETGEGIEKKQENFAEEVSKAMSN